jgi:glycosyltransferase involved in cell wall biosynthesis
VLASPKRLRVLLMIDHAGAPGGAERFVAGLAAYLPRDRIEPWVCSTRQGDELAIGSLARAGIPHINLGRTSRLQVHRIARLVALIRSQRFDVVHAHKFGSNIWGTTIGRVCGVSVIIAHEHNWSYGGNRLRASLDGQLIGRLATRFIAVSQSSRERMIAIEGVSPDKVLVMPTAYIPHSGAGHDDIRAELGLGKDVPVIGVAAGLRPEKALEVMLEAHARVAAQVSGAQLVIAGEGPCRKRLERELRRLGTGDSVHLLGLRRDVDAILRGVNVGAMSSDWEGMPLFVFECMATNTPLVATAVGGLPEVVEDGRTGLLVPARDSVSLADALARILTDPELARRLAAGAARHLHQFTIETVANRFAELYEQLTAEARPR